MVKNGSMRIISLCLTMKVDIPGDSEIAWTKELLHEIYWEHKEELDEVAEIVLTSRLLRQRIFDEAEVSDEAHNYYYTKNLYITNETYRDCFSEEDWRKISDLFEKIHPSAIVLSLRYGHDFVSGRADHVICLHPCVVQKVGLCPC